MTFIAISSHHDAASGFGDPLPRARRSVPLAAAGPVGLVAEPLAVAPPLGWERAVYRPSPGRRLLSAAAALALVASFTAVLFALQFAARDEREARRPQVVSMPLTPPPPPRRPPPPEHRAEVEPPRAAIVAPPPALVIPRELAPVPTTPVAAPPQRVPGPAAGPPAPAAAPAAPPAIADGGNLSSRMLSAKPPAYPIESRHLREMGTVTLAVLVSTDGAVAEISVAESSGSARLDQAALGAVRKWRWVPLVRDGQPVMVRGRVRIPFVLKG